MTVPLPPDLESLVRRARGIPDAPPDGAAHVAPRARRRRFWVTLAAAAALAIVAAQTLLIALDVPYRLWGPTAVAGIALILAGYFMASRA